MIKKELCDFNVSINGEEKNIQRVPFSVRSLLGEKPESIEATFSLQLDEKRREGEFVFLKISELPKGARVSVSGIELYHGAVARRGLCLDITSALSGSGILEITVNDENAGIFAPVELVRTDFAIIDKVHVTQLHEAGKTVLNLRLEALGAVDSVRAVATLVSGAGQIYYAGLTGGKGTITVPDPLYWWPKGLGVQNLYKLTVNLYGNMEIEDTLEMRVGIRSLTTANSADGSLLEVGGVSFLPMGATYRAPSVYNGAETDRALEAEIGAAARSGFNTLVITSDSPFPSERFFELCDAYGIVAVRECADVDAEAELLRSVAHHPSVGIVDIVGAGDEIDVAAEKLHSINAGFEFSAEEQPVKYPGDFSLPTYKTLRDSVAKEERNLFSETVEEGSQGRVGDMLDMVREEHLYPSDLYGFSYSTAVLAAERAAERIAKARIGRGRAGRAVISTLSPSGSLADEAMLDSMRRPKAPAYKTAASFAPVTVIPERDGYSVAFTASNESRKHFIGALEYKIIDRFNRVIFRGEDSCVVESSGVKRLFVRDFSEWLVGHEKEYYLEYTLREGNGIAAGGTLLFVPAKRFRFEDPEIEAHIAGEDRRFTVTLTAKAYVRALELDFEDTDVIFHENYIDLTSPAPVKISFTVVGGMTTRERLASSLRLRSLR